MAVSSSEYPVQLEFDPPTSQNRLTALLRPILTIPHWIALIVLGIPAGVVWILASFSILLTGRYPRGLLRFSIGVTRWSMRVFGYGGMISDDALFVGGFLTDRYPPFSLGEHPDYPIRLIVPERVEGRNRLTGFFPVRIVLVLPHVIILAILRYIIVLLTIVAWLAAIALGHDPNWLHNILGGYIRWNIRVSAYAGLLVDEYPPFSFR